MHSVLCPSLKNMDNKIYSCWDDVVDGARRDEELDSILSILDFPMEALEVDGLVADWDASKLDYLGPIPSDDVLMGLPAISHARTDMCSPVLVAAPDAPPVDAPEAKIPPRLGKCNEIEEQGVFQSQSPISVLENSGSSSGKMLLTKSNIAKQTRSKRRRPSGSTPWSAIVVTSQKTSIPRGRRLSQRPVAIEHSSEKAKPSSDHVGLHAAIVKKCSHCDSTKTPQWREGPLGPKTLCNACGVRYRSGRLFPEYRPAASPTFVAALHSNSHKRVMQMRSKAKEQVVNFDRIHSL